VVSGRVAELIALSNLKRVAVSLVVADPSENSSLWQSLMAFVAIPEKIFDGT